MICVRSNLNIKEFAMKNKALLSICSVFVLILLSTILAVSVYAVELPSDYTKHMSVPDGYTPVYSADELIITDLSGKYILMNDIDTNGNTLTPIGTSTAPFTGVFNGNGYAISNAVFGTVENTSALFAFCDGATIKNLAIIGASASVNANDDAAAYAAAIAAVVNGNTTINNCVVSGAVSVDSVGKPYVGSVAAYVDASLISNCNSTANVSATTYDKSEATFGGIAGYMIGNAKILSCNFDGRLSGDAFSMRAGGIVGASKRGSDIYVPLPSIINCVNNSNISLSQDRGEASIDAGAIIGDAQNAYISYCANNGNIEVVSTLGAYAGGIAAVHARNTVSMCVNNGNVSATSTRADGMAGGIVASGTYSHCTDNYNTGRIYVSGISSAMAGGIYGQSKMGNTYSTSYNIGLISSEDGSRAGTFVGITAYNDTYTNVYALESQTHSPFGYTESSFTVTTLASNEMELPDSFDGFNFDGVWEMPTSTDYLYPTLTSYKPVLYGDVDGDGFVDTTDFAILARHYANWQAYKDITIPETCDLDENGVIDSIDILILGRHLSNFYGYSVLPLDK